MTKVEREQIGKNPEMICENPNCNNKTNSTHTRYCKKCSLRKTARDNRYKLDEENEIKIEDGQVGYILKLK